MTVVSGPKASDRERRDRVLVYVDATTRLAMLTLHGEISSDDIVDHSEACLDSGGPVKMCRLPLLGPL